MKVNFPHNALLIGAAYAGFADAVGAHAAGHGAAQTVFGQILLFRLGEAASGRADPAAVSRQTVHREDGRAGD